jgi:RimJ/RimL family protein N-acetyltransferase
MRFATMTTIPPLPVAIETDRLIIRPFAPDDAPALYEAVDQSRERVGRWLPWVSFYTDQSAADSYIETCRRQWSDATQLPFAIFDRESGRFLGGVAVHATRLGYPTRWDWRIFETGYWLREGTEGKGYMREAVRAIVRLVFQHFNANKLALRCDARNDASRRVAESIGFQLDRRARHESIATDGSLRDTLFFSLLPNEAEKLIASWGPERFKLILPVDQTPRPFEPQIESDGPIPDVALAFALPVCIETPRLIVRPAIVEDAPALLASIERSRPELTPWIRFARAIHILEDAERFCRQSMSSAAERRRFDLHVFERETGAFVGGGTFHNMNWQLPNVELGWWLDSGFTGRGYGQEIVRGLIAFVFDEWKVERAEAWCHAGNLASRRLAARSGLIEEGIVRSEYPDLTGLPADWAVSSLIASDRALT